MAVRYVEKFDADKRVEQDRAYRDAMEKVAAQLSRRSRDRHALRRRAVPARTAARHARHQRSERPAAASGARERPVAETSIIRAPATSTSTPPSPRSCPDAPKRAPSSSAGRFPAPATSTTCRRTPGTKSGRWGDSVRANLEAWHSDQKAAIGEGFAIYPEHNLHMLLYAASYDGQGAIATRAGEGLREADRRHASTRC